MKIKHWLAIGVLLVAFVAVVAILVGVRSGKKTEAQPPVSLGLMAYLPFDGDARDASGNGNHGTISDVVLTTNRFGQPQRAYYFSGKGAHVAVTNSPTLSMTNAVSVAAWVKVEPGGIEQPRIIHKHVFDLRLSDRSGNPQICFDISRMEEGVATVMSSRITSNEWIFVAGTYDGQILRLYTNGVLAAQTNTSIPIETNDLPVGIGRDLETGTDWFKGCIDEVRIYNRALSETEVQQLYQLPQ